MTVVDRYGGWGGENVVRLPLIPKRASLRDPSRIPPRPWLYGTYALRGFVTVLVAAGGTGKSMLALSIAASVAAGKPLLNHHIHHRVNAWYFNLEDPLDESDRRLAAAIMYHQLDDELLDGTLFLNSGREDKLCIAKVGDDGNTIVYPDRDAIVKGCKDCQIGLIVIDPFVKSHELLENNNGDMDKAVTAWNEIADEAACAVILVHHVRKGIIVDIDAARGGKSLIDGARVGLTMAAMTKEEAESLNISEADKGRYVRLDDGKVNMSQKSGEASWFEIKMVDLHNGTLDYPKGDKVGVVVPWAPPALWKSMQLPDIAACLDQIAAGPSPGTLYAPSNRGANNNRWVGNPIMQILHINDKQALEVVGTWMKNGLLYETTFDNPATRKKGVSGVLVDRSKQP